ncbi:MAG: ATP-binding protein [Nitrospirota bacterium]
MSILEDQYKAFLQQVNLQRARVGAITAASLVMIFATLDFFSYPEYAKIFFLLRVVCTASLLITLALSYTKFGLTYSKALGIFEMSSCAIMINIMTRHAGYETPYYAGLNLVILAIGVLYPWSLKETFLTSGFIYVCYLVPILLFDKISNVIIFVNNNIFILATIIIACIASFFASALRQREFAARFHLEAAKVEIETSYTKLKGLDQLKSRFFANISHEFRTPITLLMGPTEMMLKRELGAITENQEKYLRTIYTHASRLLRLINTLLNLSKVDASETKLLLQRGNFVKLVREIVYSIIPSTEKKGLRLSFSGDETIPEFLYDPDKMEDVLFNLLSNALKFTERGEICVSCEMQWDNVLVKISDTGIGIPKESIQKLFDRFFQVDTAASRVGAGTGIGLSLVKEWVDIHKGRIWVESEEGIGTTFFFTIPMRIGEIVGRGDVERCRSPDRQFASVFLEGQMGLTLVEEIDAWKAIPIREGADTILLVDDSADMLHYLSDQLKSEYNLLLARDGAEGVDRARTERPDLIISDIMMPVKDGYQLCTALKSDPQTAMIPIIFLTAKGTLSDKIEGLEQGADDYLTKPFNKEELRARVCSLLQKMRLQKEVLEKNKELGEALEKLRRIGRDLAHSEKMEALGLLTAGVAHEIRNPICFAKASLAVLQDRFYKIKGEIEGWKMSVDERSDTFNEMALSLGIIKDGILRSEAIVNNLTLFAQKEDLFESLNLSNCLNTALELTQHEWSPRIEIHCDYGDTVLVEGSVSQINQALLNVLQNAIYAILGEGEIFIQMYSKGQEIVLTIRDTGSGIDECNLPRVFEPFFTTKAVGKGAGLGLAITYKIIVETHHGKIDIKSREGEGTEVSITLPIAQNATKETR